MSIVDVFISLKITDNTARSALYALQNRMGLLQIKALKRWDVWELEFSEENGPMDERVKDWVENTALFMNPNKHVYKMQSANTPLLNAVHPPDFCRTHGSIFVYDREDGHGESVFHSIRSNQQNGQSLVKLLHGVWWDVTCDDTVPDASSCIQNIAKTTHRSSGLFANPHYQDVKLYMPTAV